MREEEFRNVFARTHGHCHFCGDPIVFVKRGWSAELNGHWEVDHVVQRDKVARRTLKTVYQRALAATAYAGTGPVRTLGKSCSWAFWREKRCEREVISARS